jgi:hypothetical protein
MRTHIVFAVIATLLAADANAGSLLGADLQYVQVEGLIWSFSVFTYDDPFGPADTPELFATFDGSTVDTVPRVSQTLIPTDCGTEVYRNTYTWQRTFPGPGVYPFSAWKGNRVNTVNLPSTPDGKLCLSSTIIITSGMPNSSPVFGAPQRALYYVGNTLVHDPMVSDPDGDSLSFTPHVPQGAECQPLVGFQAPAQSTPEGDFTILDPGTGLFQWVQPNTSGVFAVAITCTEWRDGVAIGSVTRDMTICVQAPFTAMPEPAQSDMTIVQASGNGPVTIQFSDYPGSVIDIVDARGAMVQHVRPSGPRTILPIYGLVAGIYFVKLTNGSGAISAARFVVTR